MKTSMKILITVITIAAVSLLGILWAITSIVVASPFPKPKPSPTPEVLDNGWYRFTDLEAGYSISYPPDSYLSVSEDVALEYKQVTITFPTTNDRDYHTIQIIVYAKDERLSFRQIVEEKVYKGRSPKKGNDIPLTPVSFIGFDAVKMTMPPFEQAIFVSAKNKIYFISLPYDMQSGNPPTPDAIEVFNKILNTFSIK